jgi:pantoate--beta-alanine ligase
MTIVTIFVNPTQFAPEEDFDKYPRTLESDLEALVDCDVDLVFAPSSEEVYPAGTTTAVEPPHVARRWEGQCRPGHFRGVATVVLKLFHMAMTDVAYFGQKDYQQALVIRHMVRDLDVPIRICVCPIIREPDGLAMSSRNRYLDPRQRRQALALSEGLQLAERAVQQGEQDAGAITARVRQVLTDAGIERIDYVALVDPDTLEPVAETWSSAVALIAAYVGDTRLIDNRRMERS